MSREAPSKQGMALGCVFSRANGGENRTLTQFHYVHGCDKEAFLSPDCPQVPVEMVFGGHRHPSPQSGIVDAMRFGKVQPRCQIRAKSIVLREKGVIE